MKKIILLLHLVLLSSCNAQTSSITKSYTQKVEYGLNGNVKEMKKYVCKVENNKIPLDTVNFFSSYIKTFDEFGNSIEDNRLYKNKIQALYTKLVFSGKGKDVIFKQIASIDNQKNEEAEYKFVWIDDYTYKIVDINDENYINIIKLNNDFTLIENYFKKDNYEYIEKIETIVKNNRIEKIKNTTTIKTDDKVEISYNLQVAKKYDKYNNPTILYAYDTLDEKQVIDIIFNEYIYYN